MNTNHIVPSTTPRLTLREAVVNAITELKANGSFNTSEVTACVYGAANSGEIELPGFESTRPQDGIKYDVQYADVKQVIKTLLNDGTLAHLGLTNVSGNGEFLVYEFTNVAPANKNAVPVSNVGDTDDDQSPLCRRITSYLNKVGSATLKQLQSALKVNGITCQDFADIVTNLGFEVTPGTEGCYSTYKVRS